MTYCLAIKLDSGLVFASDSRTNAGVDYVTTYSKMHTFYWPGERMFVLLSAGNLATTQAVVNTIKGDLENPKAKVSLKTVRHLFEAAHYIGQLSQQEQRQHAEPLKDNNISGEASFILGGQTPHGEPAIYLIYPQGNYISASPETPYLQIGESKYGRPILDRIIRNDTSLDDAARCALVSLDSTIRSNVSVGPPVELAAYAADSFEVPRHLKLTLNSPLYKNIQKRWNAALKRSFDQLPRIDWDASSG